ncbi:MAG TPA: AraC family ligand binding domain-containing protein [Gaiellaceae bacterium]|nr:AraC family ligand binding domain-containing protein [Gaiellaceae bacterium]
MKRVHLDEIESLPALGGELQWKPVRHTLGVDAFGINAYRADNVGDLVVEDHADPHQELYAVVSGSARFNVEGEEFDAPAGTLVLLAPGEHRVAHATAPGTTVLAVGAEAARFEPSAWEYSFRAAGLIGLGRLDQARQALAEGKERYPEIGFHFQSARLAAAEGDAGAAREHLRRAEEADPSALERARGDPLLAELV